MKYLSIYLIPILIWISIPGSPVPFVFEVKTPIGFATPAPNSNPLATPRPSKGFPLPTPGVKTPIGV